MFLPCCFALLLTYYLIAKLLPWKIGWEKYCQD
jgi:hypothetical protein